MMKQPYAALAYAANESETTRVLLVDDNATIRRMVSVWLAPTELTVVGDVADGHAALEATVRLRPDVILMDYQMPIMDGLTATRLLKQRTAAPKVVLFTSDDVTILEPAAMQAGVDALLDKGCSLQFLEETLRQVVAGYTWVAGHTT